MRTGLDALLDEALERIAGRRIGLVTNPSGTDRALVATVDRLRRAPGTELVALFGPEHGVRGDAPAGAAVPADHDARSGLPVHSLYGAARRPTAAMLEDIELLVFDLQDVGARPYTYASTLTLVLEAAAGRGLPVVVLDRPDPLGGWILEGPVLEPDHTSFVGLHPLPLRHGLTIGELARFANARLAAPAELTVLPLRGWRRGVRWPDTGLPWVPPSPNLPTPAAALAFAGTVLVEGTNLSEGRGTPLPFEQVGAPFVDAHALAGALRARRLPGVAFRPACFAPCASKHAGAVCHGVQLHVTDDEAFRPVATALELLAAVRALHPDAFAFLPAEGTEPPFFDLLVGNAWVRAGLLAGEPVPALAERWRAGLERYAAEREEHLLYR